MLTALVAASSLVAGCGENATPWTAGGEDPSALCMPNLDGRIDFAELQSRIGQRGRYRRVLGPVDVDVDGTVDAQGRRVWDWRATPAGGTLEVEVAEPGWWRDEVPEATMALPLGDADAGWALASTDERGLWLHGVASAAGNPPGERTLLRYAAPIPALRFPFEVGDQWGADVQTTGTLDGLPWQGSDHWRVQVDGNGKVLLPGLSAGPALRVRTSVEVRSALGPSKVQHQTSLYFECLGELGRAVTAPTDVGTPADYGAAAEQRILEP
ncbi:MAG: hypothetical protein RIT45_1199 [Pseudomonadota bacterium]|jgi:hypothetical protein